MNEREAREIWDAAVARWLAEPGASRSGLLGILIGTITTEGHPELLAKAAEHADRMVSVDRVVQEHTERAAAKS